MSMSDAFNDPSQQTDDVGKQLADILLDEIDKEIIKELLDIYKKIREEDYDRAMKGIL